MGEPSSKAPLWFRQSVHSVRPRGARDLYSITLRIDAITTSSGRVPSDPDPILKIQYFLFQSSVVLSLADAGKEARETNQEIVVTKKTTRAHLCPSMGLKPYSIGSLHHGSQVIRPSINSESAYRAP